ncbi:hypothetical protein MLD38_017258 [Melastoma candidum]|nr:hypothetical protein MLD38_017258 [Melastoma candidum]
MRVEYDDQVLAYGPVEPFVLAGRSNHSFCSSIAAADVTLLPSVGTGLKKIKEPSDTVKMNVTLLSWAGVVVPHWRTERRRLTVVCRDVTAHFPSNTTSSVKSDCYVDL